MSDRYPYERERGRGMGSGDAGRGPVERAGDEMRSWLGDDEAAWRRRMDERARYEAGTRERWGTPSWASERSYSPDREYGDRTYGWPRGERDHHGARDLDRDDAWRHHPGSSAYAGNGHHVEPNYGAAPDAGYPPHEGRPRFGSREWSSTEGWRVPGPHAGRGPRGYQRSDERIRDEINERLTAHGLIDATEVDCQVVNGEVTLTGFVDSRAAKRAAEDVAEDIYGVRDVHNQIRVRSHHDDGGVGRTSVLGLTETQVQTANSPAAGPEAGRGRTRS
jgi:hypothetical protein